MAMAEMVGERGKVIGIEKHPQLTQLSVRNVRAGAPHWLEKGVVEVRCLGRLIEHCATNQSLHPSLALAAAIDGTTSPFRKPCSASANLLIT